MKRLALATALATGTAFAAPAFADSHAASIAVMHFNMFADNASELIMEPAGDGPVTMELVPGTTLADVFAILNMDADNISELVGRNGVTIIMSEPSHAVEIFRRLRLADDDN